MNIKRSIFLILPLFLVLIQSASASELAKGTLGMVLSYIIDSPMELKVEEDVPINFKFVHTGSTEIMVKTISVQIWGAGINSTALGIGRRLAADIELRTFDSVNATILVKPLREGIVTIMVFTEYDWTDSYGNRRNEWGNDQVYLYATMNTRSELLVSENFFRNLSYTLVTTTIAFIATTIYLVKKLKAKRT